MKLWGRENPKVPALPNEADPPPKERIIERHIVERVEGTPGRDGVDGRNAIPTALYRYSVSYRRDARNPDRFVRSSIVPETDDAARFAGDDLRGMYPSFVAPCLLRTSLGSGINSPAVVGMSFGLIRAGGDVLASEVPPSLKPNVRDNVPALLLTLTVEAYNDER